MRITSTTKNINNTMPLVPSTNVGPHHSSQITTAAIGGTVGSLILLCLVIIIVILAITLVFQRKGKFQRRRMSVVQQHVLSKTSELEDSVV